jgi:hypothetical protein
MRGEKRRWIYTGLGLPAGIALVRHARERSERPSRLLLMGGEVARALAPPLGRLARDARVELVLELRPGVRPQEWLERGWMVTAIELFQPELTLVGLEPHAPLEAELSKLATPVMWLSPERHLPQMHPAGAPGTMRPDTASGYAAWAAAVWRSIY